MGAIASLITSLTIVYSAVYSDADQSKHQSSASLAFVWGIHRGPVNSPHKWPVTRKMFPFDDVIMSIFEADIDSEKLRWMLSPTQRNIYSIKNLTVKIFIIAISPVLSILSTSLTTSRSEAFVPYFRHWVSEVFTPGGVSLSNIVLFSGCNCFETFHIFSYGWLKVINDFNSETLNVKYETLEMVVSCRIVTNFRTELFPNTAARDLSHSTGWISTILDEKWSPTANSPASFSIACCMPQHMS